MTNQYETTDLEFHFIPYPIPPLNDRTSWIPTCFFNRRDPRQLSINSLGELILCSVNWITGISFKINTF